MKNRLLVIATAYQSMVTILDTKLKMLSMHPQFEIFAASTDKEPGENRIPAIPFFPVAIPRNIRISQDVRAIAKLMALLKRNKINLIHTHTAKAGIVGACAGWLCKIPVVHTYHGLPFYPGQKKYVFRVYQFIEVTVSRLRSCIFSQNWHDYETLLKLKAIKCPVYFESNGVDIENIAHNANTNKIDLPISEKRIRVVCSSRLEPVKHLEKVVAAVDYALSQGIQLECIIAGKGILKDAIERQIKKKHLEQYIWILYTPYIHALIKSADIMILTSEKEGIPRSLMEGMALKKAILATDVVGTRELIRNNECGILVAFDDQNRLNEKLVALAKDPALRQRLGESGYNRVMSEFNERRIVDLWIEKYREILSG